MVKVHTSTEHVEVVSRDNEYKNEKVEQKKSVASSSSVVSLLGMAASIYESAASTAKDKKKRKFAAGVVKLAKRSHELSCDGLEVRRQAAESDSE